MEEILASIRRIIADDDGSKTANAEQGTGSKPALRAAAAPPRSGGGNSQDDVDAMLAVLDEPPPARTAAPAKPEAAKPETPKAEPVKSEPAKPEPAKAEAAPEVLMLTEAMAAQATQPAPAKPASGFRTIDAASDVVFTDKPQEPSAFTAPSEEPRRPPPSPPKPPAVDPALVSNTTAAAVDRAFSSLAQTVIGQNARTLEDLVKEMLRPILKSWLDDNLPGLVERIVRAEIERVSRGR